MDYLKLTEIYEELEKTTKRLEKTDIIAKILKSASSEDISYLIPLLRGQIFPSWDKRKIGVSSKLVIKTLSSITGESKAKIEKDLAKTGDLGIVAYELIKKNPQRTLHVKHITIKKVLENIRSLAKVTGAGAVNKKVGLMSELLTSAKPSEAKFIVRTILEDLRVGVGEGIIRDAIVWGFLDKTVKYDKNTNNIIVEDRKKYNEDVKLVEHTYNLTNDYSEVAKMIKEKGAKGLTTKLKVGAPIKVMLAIRVESSKEAIKALDSPILCDYKLDGFRLQIHKDGNNILLFTRRLENVTKQFQELIPIIKKNVKARTAILDSEVIGIDPKTKKYLPFQSISQRIKRKYKIEKIAKEIPVEIDVFDILYKNEKNLMPLSQKERRKILEKTIHQVKNKIVLTKKIIVHSEKEIETFYKQSLRAGNEGIMIKNLKKEYTSGRRVGGWVKLKPILETLDLVITGAQWGEGKRARWLSSFNIACQDNKKQKFLNIGKVGTGIKEKAEGVTFKQLTKILRPLIIKQKGKVVEIKPKIIVEVNYEEIQRSPTYSSGYALRFPRVSRLRPDKRLKDINTIAEIQHIYKKQKARSK